MRWKRRKLLVGDYRYLVQQIASGNLNNRYRNHVFYFLFTSAERFQPDKTPMQAVTRSYHANKKTERTQTSLFKIVIFVNKTRKVVQSIFQIGALIT